MTPVGHLDQNIILSVFWVLFTLMTILIVLRIWVRIWLMKALLRIDDSFSLATWAMLLICLGFNTYFVLNESRYPQNVTEFFQPENYAFVVRILKMSWSNVHLYYAMLLTLKAAFLALYFQLVARLPRRYWVFLWFVVGYVVIGFVVAEILTFTWCRPIKSNWDPLSFCTTFWSRDIFLFAFVQNVSSDIMIMLFPLFLLRSLAFKRHEKVAFGFVFCIGAISVGASTVRYIMISNATKDLDKRQSYGGQISLWSAVEIAAGFIANCLPTFRQYLSKVTLRTSTTVTGRSSSFKLGSKKRSKSGVRDDSLLESRQAVCLETYNSADQGTDQQMPELAVYQGVHFESERVETAGERV